MDVEANGMVLKAENAITRSKGLCFLLWNIPIKLSYIFLLLPMLAKYLTHPAFCHLITLQH